MISAADSGSDFGCWMTGGNHTNVIRFGLCADTQHHVLTHNTGSMLIPSLLQLTFPVKDNITQLPASCFEGNAWVCMCVFFVEYRDVSDRHYYTMMAPTEGHTFISCPTTYLGLIIPTTLKVC